MFSVNTPFACRARPLRRDRRDFLVPRLREIGFGVPAAPAGAFYVFANASRFCTDSIAFAKELLEHTSVSITPGLDFGPAGARCLRLSYTASRDRIADAMDRLQAYLNARPA
ncbi:MAG: aminotransferase class I/II-fold pyridoxal phosphate-dependent enzyme [Proteobacteria bacterium]|nr:aminotransferase class I/II-fold pyridoxal phosphate-dependent enzyme [Pseudomonadota bacterium]